MSSDRFEQSYHVDGPCPICGKTTTQTELTAYNVSLSGGFAAAHAEDKAVCADATDTHAVWIDGIECYMGEARFGGIVTQPAGR